MNSKISFVSGSLVLIFALTATLAYAQDFDEHFLAAACVPYASRGDNGKLFGRVLNTAEGVAVEHSGTNLDIVLYCNVDVEVSNFFNLLQVVAEDNTPTGHVTATLFQKNLDFDGPPVAIESVTTTDQPGVQRPATFTDLTLNEIFFHYYIEVTLHREDPNDVIRVYSVSLRDVL